VDVFTASAGCRLDFCLIDKRLDVICEKFQKKI
jgi:hypothetical protein